MPEARKIDEPLGERASRRHLKAHSPRLRSSPVFRRIEPAITRAASKSSPSRIHTAIAPKREL